MKYFICLMLLAFSYPLLAQDRPGKISGIITDASNKPVEAATVELLVPKSGTLVKMALTDKEGKFEMEKINEGDYILSVTAIGFSKKTSPVSITAAKSLVQLPAFQLAQASDALKEVVITQKKPLVENKIDKTVVNVESFISAAGSSAMDMLEKSPGVSVDKDGNISLKGKQGIIILIDGKQTYLAGQDLANYLKNLPANQLETIEIMTQPSAKYDAAGNSGIINLRTKKSKQSGFNGSVNLSYVQGMYPKFPNSANFNFNKNKVNVFANYSYTYWQNLNRLYLMRKFHDDNDNLTAVFDQLSENSFKGYFQNLRTGLDYSIDKKTTIGFVVNVARNRREFGSNSVSKIMNGNAKLDSTNTALTRSRDPWRNFSANVNFRRLLDTSGTEITADADVIIYGSKNRQTSDNFTSYPGYAARDTFLLKAYLPSQIRIYSAKIDFVHPFNKNSKMEAGLKTSYVETDNDAQYNRFDLEKDDWFVDKRRSNHFLYNENINAAYVNYNIQVKKWGFQGGLRYEQTNSKGKQITTNTPFNRKYEQLFPTTYVSYTLNEKNNFNVSYGRRIERPNYRDMNPFQYFLDQYTYETGNPYLTPQFSHNFQLSHNFKGELNTTVNYTRTTDIINEVLKQNDTTKVTFLTRENIAERENIGLSLSYNKSLVKWWTTSVFFNIFQNHFEGLVNNQPLDAKIISYMFNSNNQFKFNKGWGAELSGFYRSKMQEGGMMLSLPMGVISVGASKQVLKEKGTLRLSIRDPFYIQQFRADVKFGNIDMTIRNKWDNRTVALNFTYRFGKQANSQPPRRRNSSAQEEQNRAGGGGGQQ